MSFLLFLGLFSLRGGHSVETTFTKRTGDKGIVKHTHYGTAVACRHPPQLPADLRIYARSGDRVYSDNTVAIVVAKGHIPAPDVAGDLLFDAMDFAPFPGDPSAPDYDKTLPDLPWPWIFGLGDVSGPSNELPNGQVTFPVTASDYVRGTSKQSTILYVLNYIPLFSFLNDA